MGTTRTRRTGARVLMALAIALAGCGGDDGGEARSGTTTEAGDTRVDRSTTTASTTTSTSTSTSTTTTAPPPPPVEEIDLRAVPIRILCFDGELEVVADAASTPSPSGDVLVDLFEITHADADGDGRTDAVIRATCVFADGGNAAVASVAVVGSQPGGPVQVGQPVEGYAPEVVDGVLVVSQSVDADTDPTCCPSAVRHVPFALAGGRWAGATGGDPVEDDQVTTAGLGALAVGRRYAEVAGRAQRPLLVEDPLQTDGACVYAAFDGLEGVHALGSEGTVRSVQVTSDAVRTRSGLGVGSPAADVHAAFPGRVTATPHEYVTGGEYLTFTPVDEPDRLVVFETDGTTVTAFRAGEAAWATLVEGCA
jgi:hypothetical protein